MKTAYDIPGNTDKICEACGLGDVFDVWCDDVENLPLGRVNTTRGDLDGKGIDWFHSPCARGFGVKKCGEITAKRGSDHCKTCGSENLWANFFDEDGFGSDGNGPTDVWQTQCGDCGTIQ